ncbi:hypothetical protein [Photobacterium sp. J15]|uniref:hypothetical protein n=1 Tax=Photobacterium sp. J15 TaxID=265901 RepID=UPI0007E3C2C8|nr:hypothetical protein [Photobacterium sp. J15]
MLRTLIVMDMMLLLLNGCNSSTTDNLPIVDHSNLQQISIPQTPELLSELDGKNINEQLTILYGKYEPLLDRSGSLLGIDNNNDGIRDDVGAFIDALVVSEQVRKAIRQQARQFQKILAHDFTMNTEEAYKRAVDINTGHLKSSACMEYNGIHIDDEIDTVRTLIALTYNTRARAYAYLSWKNKMDGLITTLVESKEESCE